MQKQFEFEETETTNWVIYWINTGLFGQNGWLGAHFDTACCGVVEKLAICDVCYLSFSPISNLMTTFVKNKNQCSDTSSCLIWNRCKFTVPYLSTCILSLSVGSSVDTHPHTRMFVQQSEHLFSRPPVALSIFPCVVQLKNDLPELKENHMCYLWGRENIASPFQECLSFRFSVSVFKQLSDTQF